MDKSRLYNGNIVIDSSNKVSPIIEIRQKLEAIIAGFQRRIRLGTTSYLLPAGIFAISPSRRPCFRPGKQIHSSGRRKRRGHKRLEKVFPGCGREKRFHRCVYTYTYIRTSARGCARVGVYLYICHDLNRDNPPGFIPKSIIRITL